MKNTPNILDKRRAGILLHITSLPSTFDLELKNHHLPHHHLPSDIVYTGTHDSNTTVGWFQKIKEKNHQERQKYLCNYLSTQPENVS
ncbi:hypothetical protein BGP_0044 [Beggiatoa sp. PS]|nr:hypothetical protein BGP_0044 [Beggiatoa sp. PS]